MTEELVRAREGQARWHSNTKREIGGSRP